MIKNAIFLFIKSLIVKIISVNIMKFLYYIASIGNNNIDIKVTNVP